MSDEVVEKLRGILEKLVRDEVLPERAGKVVARMDETTTPAELGMDSLARFMLMGELKKAFGTKIDPHAISSAACLGDVLRAVRQPRG